MELNPYRKLGSNNGILKRRVTKNISENIDGTLSSDLHYYGGR